jgi:2'-hydroxyisoflavone reductase
MFINVAKAVAAGLRIRPLGDTIRDTLTWARAELSDTSLKAGIDIEREQALLRKWHRSGQP